MKLTKPSTREIVACFAAPRIKGAKLNANELWKTEDPGPYVQVVQAATEAKNPIERREVQCIKRLFSSVASGNGGVEREKRSGSGVRLKE